MKRKLMIGTAVLLALLIAAGVLCFFATREQRAVRELVNETVALVRKEPSNLPHAGVLKFTKVEKIFGQTVKIKSFKPSVNRTFSQEDLKILLNMMNRHIVQMDVATGNIKVDVRDDLAEFAFDADISGVVSGKDDFSSVCQIRGEARKISGDWKIISVSVEPVVK